MSRYLTLALLGTFLLSSLASTASAQSGVETRFRQYDTNGDGKVSREEYVGKTRGPARESANREFGQLDQDPPDQFLSEDEYKAGQTDWLQILKMCGIVLAVVVLPFVVGSFLASRIQMRDYALRLGVILFAITVGSVAVIFGWPPALGPDLSGGVILVYEIDQGKRINDFRPKVIEQIADAIEIAKNDRLAVAEGEGSLVEVRVPRNQRAEIEGKISAVDFEFGVELESIGEKKDVDHPDSVVLVYEMKLDDFRPVMMSDIAAKIGAQGDDSLQIAESGSDQIEVRVPSDRQAQIADQIKTLDFSEYGTLLNSVGEEEVGDDVVLRYEIENVQQKGTMDELIPQLSKRLNRGGVKEVSVRKRGNEQVEIIVPLVEGKGIEKIEEVIETAGALEFRIVPSLIQNPELADRATKTSGNTVYNGEIPEARWVKLSAGVDSDDVITRENKGEMQVLVLLDTHKVFGKDLSQAMSSYDQLGRPAVNFRMKPGAANRFGELTEENINKLLGIVLDDELMSAANIRSRISDSGEITGSFTQERVDFVVSILKAGELSAELNDQPISREVIGPLLGKATVRSGTIAMIASMALVLVFMLFYYRFAGLVACLALVLNVLMVLAIMIMVGYEFTLAGFAGLVLTVGMAVDANVLIFERIREEMERGAALRMAIRNGFAKATTTIVDANLTTLITAIVLFWIGTEQVKGFAVTLILGISMSMFTAIYCSRVVFDIAEKKRLITKLSMTKMFGKTNIDFIGKRFIAATASLILIVIGLVATFERGKGLLDIDFTGGSTVTVYFDQDQPLEVAEVRKIAEENLEDTQVSRVQIEGEDPDLRYKVSTSERDLKQVSKLLLNAFGDRLRTIEMDHDTLVKVDLSADDAATTPEKPATDRLPSTKLLPEVDPDTKVPKEKEPASPPTTGEDGETKPETKEPAEPVKEEPTKEEPAKTDTDKTETPKEESSTDDAKEPDAPKEETPKEEAPAEPSKADGAALRTLRGLAAGHVAALALLQDDGEPATEAETPQDTPADSASEGTEAATDAETTPADDKDADTESEPASSEEQPQAGEDDDLDPEDAIDEDDPTLRDFTPLADPPAKPVVGTKTKLTFGEETISQPSLMTVFEHARKKLEAEGKSEYAAGQVNATFSNPQYSPGSNVAYKEWTFEVDLAPEQAQPLLDEMAAELKATPIFPSSSNISGRVMEEMQVKAIAALLVSLLFIVGYIWIRFQSVVFGLAAVVALIHDVLITLGAIAISAYVAGPLEFLQIEPFKISLPIVAAFLTIIGYSLNDTIVVFDRIREVRGKSPDLTEEVVNTSINQTISRTLLTSITTLIVVVILYFFGGPGIHSFAFALVVGVLVGTYSSVFVASPVLLALLKRHSNSTAVAAGQRKAASAT